VRLLRSDGVRPVKAVLHLRQRGVRTLLADIALLDADDVVVMELLECWFATADFGAAPEPAERMTWTALVPSLRQPDGAIADWLDPVFDAVAGAAATPETVILAEAMLALAARDAVAAGLQPNEHLLAPPADRRLAHMLHWLAQDGLAQRDAVAQRDGLAQRDGTCWRIAEATDLPRWQDVWRDLLFDVPAAAADAALAGAVAQALRPAGGQQATQTLPTSLVDQMLFASPTGGGAIDALLAGVEAWLDHWPAGRPLRVAEIGVAWPGLTRQLLGLLARRVPAMRYVALAADQDVLAALAESLADWPGATGNVWDRAAEQEEFDLVLGLYPFTAPRGLAATPADAAALLAAGGHLLIVEAMPNRLWQLVFANEAIHSSAAPHAPDTWQAGLEASGCQRTRSTVLAGGELWQTSLVGAWRGQKRVPTPWAPRANWAVFAAAGDFFAPALAEMTCRRPIHDIALLGDPSALSALVSSLTGCHVVILVPDSVQDDVTPA
jgi:hypothetical protein